MSKIVLHMFTFYCFFYRFCTISTRMGFHSLKKIALQLIFNFQIFGPDENPFLMKNKTFFCHDHLFLEVFNRALQLSDFEAFSSENHKMFLIVIWKYCLFFAQYRSLCALVLCIEPFFFQRNILASAKMTKFLLVRYVRYWPLCHQQQKALKLSVFLSNIFMFCSLSHVDTLTFSFFFWTRDRYHSEFQSLIENSPNKRY